MRLWNFRSFILEHNSFVFLIVVIVILLLIGIPNDLSSKALITAEDFEYQGVIKITGMGQSTQGLAYRPQTNTYFTVGYNGRDSENRHYNLFEFTMPAPSATYAGGGNSVVVKDWGPLNKNGILDIVGSPDQKFMKGLLWDETRQCLWFSHGAFYGAANNSMLGYVTFDTGQAVVHGPWRVPSSIHSDTVKGMIIKAPQSMFDITNHKFLMFGVRGSTAQQQSWGTGLVSVAEPKDNLGNDLPVGTELDSARIIHWPMRSSNDGAGAYSDFPRLQHDHVKIIFGNDLVGAMEIGVAQGGGIDSIILSNTVNRNGGTQEIFYPENAQLNHRSPVGWYVTNKTTFEQRKIIDWDYTNRIATIEANWTNGIPTNNTPYELYYPSYERNNIINAASVYREADNISHGVWIETLEKHGLLYFGYTAVGYAWYGQESAHRDPTPNGRPTPDGFDNNIDSLYYPGSKVRDPERAGIKGRHAEYSAPRWYILDPDFVLETARKVKNGTAVATDLEIPWAVAGDVLTLGGNVQLSRASFAEAFWNPETQLLYVLHPEGSPTKSAIVNVWKIKNGTTSTTSTTTSSTVSTTTTTRPLTTTTIPPTTSSTTSTTTTQAPSTTTSTLPTTTSSTASTTTTTRPVTTTTVPPTTSTTTTTQATSTTTSTTSTLLTTTTTLPVTTTTQPNLTTTTTTTLAPSIPPPPLPPLPIQLILRAEPSTKRPDRIIFSGEINPNGRKISVKNRSINITCSSQGRKKVTYKKKTNKTGSYSFNERTKKVFNMVCTAKVTINKENYSSSIKIAE